MENERRASALWFADYKGSGILFSPSDFPIKGNSLFRISIQRQRPTRLQRRSVSWRRRQSDHAEKRGAVRGNFRHHHRGHGHGAGLPGGGAAGAADSGAPEHHRRLRDAIRTSPSRGKFPNFSLQSIKLTNRFYLVYKINKLH